MSVPDPRTVPCRGCQAEPGNPCTSLSYLHKPMDTYHAIRQRDANKAAAKANASQRSRRT